MTTVVDRFFYAAVSVFPSSHAELTLLPECTSLPQCAHGSSSLVPVLKVVPVLRPLVVPWAQGEVKECPKVQCSGMKRSHMLFHIRVGTAASRDSNTLTSTVQGVSDAKHRELQVSDSWFHNETVTNHFLFSTCQKISFASGTGRAIWRGMHLWLVSLHLTSVTLQGHHSFH